MNKKIDKKTRNKRLLIILAVLIALAVSALYSGPVTRTYNIESDKITGDITIAVASDLHNQYFGENQQKIIDRIKKAQPDIILMPGDMTNWADGADAMVSFMEQAVNIAPCYYVIGNHEYWSMQSDRILDMVAATGVNVMRHEHVTLNINGNIVELFGIDDHDANYYDDDYADKSWEQHLDEMWTENTTDSYRILMTHRPERVDDYTKYEYDLIAAGHSHGGQVRIPFLLNGLWAPNQGWFPKYAGGKYELSDQTTMVVSRGLYNYKRVPRVYNPSEIVIITISQNK